MVKTRNSLTVELTNEQDDRWIDIHHWLSNSDIWWNYTFGPDLLKTYICFRKEEDLVFFKLTWA